MLKRSAIVGVLGAFLLVAMATDADAARIKQLLAEGPAPGALNIISDDSFEQLLQSDGNTTLDVGDSIRGVVNFNSIQNAKVSGGVDPLGSGGNSEFTAIFQTLVIGKKFVGTDSGGNSLYDFAFGPDPAFAEAISLGLGGSAMVLMYEDTSPDFVTGPTIAGSEGSSKNGFFFWALGMNGTFGLGPDGLPATGDEITNLDEGWIANNSLDTIPVSPLVGIGEFEVSVNRVLGGGGIGDSILLGQLASAFGSFSGVHFKGSGEFQTTTTGSAWPIADEAELVFNVLVPLPAAAWAGLGLLGLLGVGRRMRRRS
jgi:hypothetical protein